MELWWIAVIFFIALFVGALIFGAYSASKSPNKDSKVEKFIGLLGDEISDEDKRLLRSGQVPDDSQILSFASSLPQKKIEQLSNAFGYPLNSKMSDQDVLKFVKRSLS